MAMQLVKKTPEYSIFKRGDNRYAVTDANKKPVNGDDKVRVLVAQGLIKVSAPAPQEAPAAAETAPEDTAAEPAAEAAAVETPDEDEVQ
ncbi:MAG: hypothetical protein KDI16_10655 [Halioglobus sp.]|nr:hypothetical protein [Halioglobus sp.]